MTFYAGQLVVCVDMSQPVNTAIPAIETLFKMREVCRVGAVFPSKFGQLLAIEGRAPWRWTSDRFRPLIDSEDDADLIARIKNCKPAPAQPHEAEALVGPCVQTLSSHTGSVAAARDATVSNIVSPDPVETITHTDRTEGVTHRDLSQHADTCVTDLNCLAPFHGA